MKCLEIKWIIAIIILVLIISYFAFNCIKENFMSSDPMLLELEVELRKFFNTSSYKINDGNVMDHIKMYRGNKSYTLNKKKVYICMKDNDGKYYDKNMLIYVIAHELSHVLCDEIGHTPKFQEIFDKLLEELAAFGLYNPEIPINYEYCLDGDSQI